MKILCLCDSLTLTSGFARVASNLMRRWAVMGAKIDVWGIAFGGWGYKQHPYVETFFPAGSGMAADHWASQERLNLFLTQLNLGGYTHVWIMQDTFQLVNFDFPRALRKICTEKKIRSMFYFPVDAPLEPAWTDIIAAVDVPVAYTQYGADEAMAKMARRAAEIKAHNATAPADQKLDITGLNYEVRVQHVPHGVDTKVYQAISDRAEARAKFWKDPFAPPETFLMVNVNVNQRRKDVARSLEILKAVQALGVPAKLIMHMRCISDDGLNLEQAGSQLGLQVMKDWSHHHHLFPGPAASALSEAGLVQLYNIADLYLTTTLGEGWGLGITEALACGTPVAIPDHTSCREISYYLMDNGMAEDRVLLPVERHGLWQGLDNSRMRPRVDVDAAAKAIADYYHSGAWRHRRGLTQPVREWLNWDRIARAMLKLWKEAPAPDPEPAADVQTPELKPVEL